MAAFFYYASFPNSRIKPRPSTTKAVTEQITIADYSLPYTKIVTEDPNRTYMLLENFSSTTAFWYVYANDITVNPSVVPTFGSTGEMRFFTGTNTLYQKQDDGTNTNWVAVNIEDVGEKVLALQTASLDSPQDVYAAADSAVPVVPDVIVGIDKGAG